MISRPYQDGYGLVRVTLPDHRDNLPGLFLVIAPGHDLSDYGPIFRRIGPGAGFAVVHGVLHRVAVQRHYLREDLVKPVYDGFCRAEIYLQLQWLKVDVAKQLALEGPDKQAYFRLAEAVYGLHRVADQEQGAPVTFAPSGSEPLQ